MALGDSVLAKIRAFVDDDDMTAKELWDEICKTHTTSATQAIANLLQKLDNLKYNESKSWDDHVSKFLSIVDEFGSFDQSLTDSDKVTKIIRSLPLVFDPFAKSSSVNGTTFDSLVLAVRENIERRKKLLGNSSESASDATMKANFGNSNTYGRKNFRGRGGRGRDRYGGRGRGHGGNCRDCFQGRNFGNNRW